jgi:signal transduction histidine kinase
MSELAAANGLTLTADGLSPCLVLGDPDGLRRLLFNLLDNAIKYTPAGGNVRLECACHGPSAVLSVSDTGIGIPADHIPHIFDRFYRVDPARSREAGGIGLGLAICRVIVETHGGAIHVESAVGKGAMVVVTLPASQPGTQLDGSNGPVTRDPAWLEPANGRGRE